MSSLVDIILLEVPSDRSYALLQWDKTEALSLVILLGLHPTYLLFSKAYEDSTVTENINTFLQTH